MPNQHQVLQVLSGNYSMRVDTNRKIIEHCVSHNPGDQLQEDSSSDEPQPKRAKDTVSSPVSSVHDWTKFQTLHTAHMKSLIKDFKLRTLHCITISVYFKFVLLCKNYISYLQHLNTTVIQIQYQKLYFVRVIQ